MATLDVTDESFREIYQNNDIVVLDFWAIWCGPCHQFAPIYESVSEKYPDLIFGKVDTENQQNLSAYFGIRSIPTTLIIREQIEVFRFSGVLGEEDLVKIIDQVKNADMDQVKKQIEAEDPA